MLSRLGEGRPGLLLAPAGQLDEWGRVVHQASGESGLRVQVAHGTSRATRRLRGDAVDLLIATPETAIALQRRSALQADALAAVLLAWPEGWEEEESVSPLMQDLDKEAQRIVLTSAPERAADMVERYARRALTIGTVGPEGLTSRSGAHGQRAVGTAGGRAQRPDRAARSHVAGRVDGGPGEPRGHRSRHRAPGARGTGRDRGRAEGAGGHRVRPAGRASSCASS